MTAPLSGSGFDVAAAALGGLLGSVHCVGMCGGLAATCCAGASCAVPGTRLVLHSLLFTAGRIFTYAFLGMATASFGAGLWERGGVAALQGTLSVLAGAALVGVGFAAAGGRRPLGGHLRLGRSRRGALIPRLSSATGSRGWFWFASPIAAPTAAQTAAVLRDAPPSRRAGAAATAFLGGVGTGFLPCGIVYAVLVLAVASPSPVTAGLLMGSFGVGTAPLMVLSGCCGIWLSPAKRGRLHGIAGVAIVLLGLATIARGLLPR